MHFEHAHLIARIFVQSDFSDAKDVRALKESRNNCNDLFSQFHVLRFLRIDAEPREMRQTEFRRALGLMLRKLAKVIVKAIRRAAIESRPERRFANRLATRDRHSHIIIRDPADHVRVRFDVFHLLNLNRNLFLNPSFPATPRTPLSSSPLESGRSSDHSRQAKLPSRARRLSFAVPPSLCKSRPAENPLRRPRDRADRGMRRDQSA